MRVTTLWLAIIAIVGAISGLVACAHSPDHSPVVVLSPVETLPPIEVGEEVILQLGTQSGRTEQMKYVSRTLSQSYEKNEIRHSKEQEAQFVVQTDIVRADPQAGRVVQVLRTLQKDGSLDLRSLALPEVGETLEMTLTSQGEVLKAGGYPKQTLFYIPPVSLPPGPVSVGDTWTMTADWFNLEDGTPFTLDMVSILKGFVACGTDQCADIELSGEVRLPGEVGRMVGFQSQWSGRVLFARQQGSVVWSRIDSLETLRAENVTRKVHSCLESVMTEPAERMPAGVKSTGCSDDVTPSALKP